MKIKTLQWNIGGGRICKAESDPQLPASYTEDGLDSIVQFIRREQPDVVTLQETHESPDLCQTQIIAEAIGYSYWINDSYDESFIEKGQRIGQGIISKHPIIEKRFTAFSNPKFCITDDSGNEIASKNGGLTECKIEFPGGKAVQVKTFHMTPFHFFAVALESEWALKVLREVERLLGKSEIPAIIQADFNLNFPSISHLFAETFSAGMQEVIQEDPTTPKGKRLDHILYTGIENLTSRVIKDVKTDHYPVIALFQIEAGDKKVPPVPPIHAEPDCDGAAAKTPQLLNSDNSITAESLGIKPIKEDTWTFFDKRKFDASSNAKMVSISKLIQAKNHAADPDVLSGKKTHPVQKAYSYFLILSGKDNDPLVAPRKPITVMANPDGTYNIVDGAATVQAAIFVGWNSMPVIVVETNSERKSDC